MTDLDAILKECVSSKIELFFVGGRLNYRASENAGLEKIINALKQHKEELSKLLTKNPEKIPQSSVFYSRSLDREVLLSWQGDEPTIIYMGRLGFTTKEIETLKKRNYSSENLQAICQVKGAFDGEVTE